MSAKLTRKDKDGNEIEVRLQDVPTSALIMLIVEAIVDGKLASKERHMMQAAMMQDKDMRVDLNAQNALKGLKSISEGAREVIQKLVTELETRL